MDRYLITGANGFVGSAIAKRLVTKGCVVRLFDLADDPRWGQWTGVAVECVHGDLRDPTAVGKALKGCTHVIHTAALLNSVAPLDTFAAINVGGTEHLCEAAVAEGDLRFIHVSTSDVFGLPMVEGQVFDESSPFQPWGEPYADTKIAATRLVKTFVADRGLRATVLYPGWVYGEGDRQFFPAIMDMVRDGMAFTWHRASPYEINLVHIDDLTDAVELALAQDASIGRDYLVLDTGTGMTPERMFRLIAEVMGLSTRIVRLPYPVMYALASLSQWWVRRGLARKPLLSTTDVKAFGHAFLFSNRKASDELGWKPRVAPEAGVRRAVEWQLSRTAS